MARNRTIYQTEAIYVSSDISSTGRQDHHSLNRIQSASYGFTFSRRDINQYGSLSRIDSMVVDAPTVEFGFNYYVTDGFNETILGLLDSTGAAFLSGQMATDSGKNLYVVTAPEGVDANSGDYSDYSVIGVGNAFLTNYSVNFGVGQIPSVEVEFEGSNISSQITDLEKITDHYSGVENASVDVVTNTKNGSDIELPTYINQYTSPNVSAISPLDVQLTITSSSGIANLSTNNNGAHIQTASINIPINRSPLERIGTTIPYARAIDFPLNVDISVSAILNEITQRNIADVIDSAQDVSIRAIFKNREDNEVCGYTISGAKLISEDFVSDIGSNKMVNLTFSCQVGGPEDLSQNIMFSGTHKNMIEQNGDAGLALSTRRVNNKYNGSAMRIRRVTDNQEAEVFFDSSGDISESSLIFPDSGGQLTLNEFANQPVGLIAQPFSQSNSPIELQSAGSITTGVINTTDSFSSPNSLQLSAHQFYNTLGNTRTSAIMSGVQGTLYTGSFYAKQISGDSSSVLRLQAGTDGKMITTVTGTGFTDWTKHEFSVYMANQRTGAGGRTRRIVFAVHPGNQGNQTTSWLVDDINYSGIAHQCCVKTWKDQSTGTPNNFTQPTTNLQPRIIKSGKLLTGENGKVALRFNGTQNTGSTEEANDGITSQFLSGNPFTGKITSFVGDYDVSDTRNSNVNGIIGGNSSSESYIFISNDNSVFANYAISVDGAQSDVGSWYLNGVFQSAGGNLGTHGDIPHATTTLNTVEYTAADDPAKPFSAIGLIGVPQTIHRMSGHMSEFISYTDTGNLTLGSINGNILNYHNLGYDLIDPSNNNIVTESGNQILI